MLCHRSIGQEGASAEFCDLSGRGLNTSQVERTLRVFDSAVAIDMSNNELELIPTTIPTDITALDVSFNMLANARGIEHLQFLRELNLSFNRLVDVSILEYCPLLQRVNLSGNRLATTRGLETLVHLENVDLSDNLIEYADELRSLSMNKHLTHLTLRGNPIAHKPSLDYRVLVLDMITSVLILDDKKIRAMAKTRPSEAATSCSTGAAPATKSLSYSRIYDDKKQFVIRNQQTRRTPATRPMPVLLGDPTVAPKYEGSTIFLKSPKATTITHDLPVGNALPAALSPRRLLVGSPDPVVPQQDGGASIRHASPTAATGGQYVSLYDRLAAANGITKKTEEPPAPVQPEQELVSTKRPLSSHSRRDPKPLSAKSQTTTTTHNRSSEASSARPQSRGGGPPGQPPSRPQMPAVAPVMQSRPATPLSQPAVPQMQRGSTQLSTTAALNTQAAYRPVTHVSSQVPSVPTYCAQSPPPAQPQYYAVVPPQSNSIAVSPGPPPAPMNQLDRKQQNVLSVIQNLIHHKKQTLATLARQSSSGNATTVFSS